MATVPLAKGPQLRTAPLEGGFQRAPDSAEPFGAAQGRQLQAFARAGEKAMDDIDEGFQRRAVDKAFEIENKVGEAYQKKRDELLKQRQLDNAGGVAKDVEQWWASDAQELIGEVDPYTQKLLNKSLMRRREQSLGEFTTYERGQADKVGEINYETLQQNETKAAVGFIVGGNEAEGAVSLRKMEGAARAFMVSRGVPPDAIQAELDKRRGAVHSQVIDGYLANPATAAKAKEYYGRTDVKETIPRKDRAAFERRIAEMVDTQDGLKAATEAVTTAMKDKDIHDAFEYQTLDKNLLEKFKDNPEALKAARAELDRQGALWQRQQNETQAAGADGTYELLRGGASMAQIKGSKAWSQMSARQQDAFLEQQENRRRADRAQNLQDRELSEREEERRTAEAALEYTDPAALASMTIEQVRALRPVLGERNYARVAKSWQDFQGNQAKLSNAKFDNDMLNETMLAFGFDPKPKPGNKDAAATVMRARSMIDSEISRAQVTLNRELSAEEKRKLAIGVLSSGVKEKTFFGSREVPDITTSEISENAFVEMPPSAAAGGRGTASAKDRRVYFKDIPTTSVIDIKKFLEDTRQPSNDAAVLRFYANRLARQAAPPTPSPASPRVAPTQQPASGARPSYMDIPR